MRLRSLHSRSERKKDGRMDKMRTDTVRNRGTKAVTDKAWLIDCMLGIYQGAQHLQYGWAGVIAVQAV